nr:unnamed protein product [Spirometra erinaceieuropaei]
MNNGPKRKTELVVREPARYMWTLLRSARPASPSKIKWRRAERRYTGVVFATPSIVGQLPRLPQGIKDRLMRLRLPLPRRQFATITSAYASPMTGFNKLKIRFYEN